MVILLGLQWGDEGKVKLWTFLLPNAEVVARFPEGRTKTPGIQLRCVQHVLHQTTIDFPQQLYQYNWEMA
jgi:adenylosuccinate synthase